MSANNELLIRKSGEMYSVYDRCVEGESNGMLVGMYGDLEEAIRGANEYMEDNEVEYGLRIRL